ncbi:DNA cytosine methyltransferase [Pseudovibrio ascidiaceicola]|uniref:DNA cytosine methyltransferase n=1 Tax=Pseudovibrio ascidiaceicola TaxID=285279 RepID=UPI003D35A1E6
MPTIKVLKLGTTKTGNRRFWAEGYYLCKEGFTPGMGYNVHVVDDQVQLKADTLGQYTVSKRGKEGRLKPIIDLTNNVLAELFEGVERLRVQISKGKIVITAHHQEIKTRKREARLKEKVQRGQSLSVCSMFHGGGILDRALHSGMAQSGLRSGVSIVSELEDEFLNHSMANQDIWSDDVIALCGPVELMNLRKDPPEVDALFGGIPCTGASRAGRAANKLDHAESHDKAGAMFFTTLRFIEELNPSVAILENVPEYQNTASMEVIRSVLTSMDYKLSERVFDGSEFGSLEKRKRLCVVAVSRGMDPIDLDAILPQLLKPVDLSAILEDLALDADEWKSHASKVEKEKRDRKAGKGFRMQLLDPAAPSCGTIGAGYNKSRSTEPRLIHPEDPDKSRLFTPVEHARVKGIPEELVAGLPATTAHTILGQSVIWPVFEAVGSAIAEHVQRWAFEGYAKLEMAA